MKKHFKPWVTPSLLLLLGSISVLFGVFQLSLVTIGQTDANRAFITAHYLLMPVPIVLHVITGSLFNLLMPLQFAPPIRLRFPDLHRCVGLCLVICGVGFGVSALWMNEAYPPYGGTIKYLGVIAHCLFLFGSLFMAVRAIKKSEVAAHRLWMMRAAAASLSPATQRLFFLPIVAIFGEGIATDIVIGCVIWFGLMVNWLFVEWISQRGGEKRIIK